jgi:hypothetical protein
MFLMIAVLRAPRTHLPCRGFRTLGKTVGGEGLASGIGRPRFAKLCPSAHLGLAAEAAGEHEGVMRFARRAWDEREPPFILWARHFPQYRADPGFAVILREIDRLKRRT